MSAMSALPSEKAPFVNGSSLKQYVGKKVFVAGKVMLSMNFTYVDQYLLKGC